MKCQIIVVFSLIFLGGCAVPKYGYKPLRVEISEPPINSINVAYVGDRMLRQGKFSEHEAVLLKRKTTVGLLGTYTFDPGYYTKQGESSDRISGFYLSSPYGQEGRVTTGALADEFQIMQAYYNENKICGVSVLNGKMCTDDTDYEITKQQAMTSDSFQQTLIYSGRIGKKINISYREFFGSSARTAFNNDVEYDLEQSKTIGYKGAKIEILEATNELIKYRVISNFNKAKF